MSKPENAVGKKSVGQQLKDIMIKETPRETAAVWVTLAYLLFQLYGRCRAGQDCAQDRRRYLGSESGRRINGFL